MILHIIKKEVLQGMLSLRFPLTLILITAVMVSAAFLFLEDYGQQVADYDRNVKDNLQQLSRRATPHVFALAFVFSYNHQWVYRAPTRLAFLAEGHEKNLPNAFQVNAFSIKEPTRKLRGNYFLRWAEDLDWTFIVSMIMSFVAIVLVYDSVSGEREMGTLRLSMSNSVPRSTLILGKYLSAMVLLIAPLLIGTLFSVIIIATSGKVNVAGEDWIRIIMAIFLSILYVSIFVTLGLFLSSSFRSSAAGLVILLLAWTLIVVVIPGIGGTITTSLSMLGDRTDMPNLYAAYSKAHQEYIARHPDTARWEGGVWSPRDSLGKHIAMWGAFMRVYNSQCDEMVRQVRFGYNIIRISPTVVYRRAVEAVAGSGIDHYESFMKQVRRYGLMLQDCLVSYHPLDIHKQYDDRKIREAFSDIGFAAADVPKFQDKPIPIEDSMRNSMWNIAILVVFNVVFFMAAYISFLRRDIR